MREKDKAFYAAWAQFLDWMREYADGRDHVLFEKEADFTDYIYRMERPYDLPTSIMSASLSEPDGTPVLMAYASPRQAVFKEIEINLFGSHVRRTLQLGKDGVSLAEGKRPFTREMLEELADEAFATRMAGSEVPAGGEGRAVRGDAADLRRAALGGICSHCANARLVRSARGSVFLLCRHPDLPKYPRQPVLSCHGYRSAAG